MPGGRLCGVSHREIKRGGKKKSVGSSGTENSGRQQPHGSPLKQRRCPISASAGNGLRKRFAQFVLRSIPQFWQPEIRVPMMAKCNKVGPLMLPVGNTIESQTGGTSLSISERRGIHVGVPHALRPRLRDVPPRIHAGLN